MEQNHSGPWVDGPLVGFRESAFVPVLVLVGTVVSIISSLGVPLIPTIARHLHSSLSSAEWSLTAPLLVAAVASPLVGRLGDGRHRKTVIVVGLASVVAGGVLAALTASLALLIAGRAMQGMGLALMPLTMASAREHLPPARARAVIALLSVVAIAGLGLGYPITALVAEHFGVAGAFWFGTAISAAALAMSIAVIPDAQHAPAHRTLDLVGAAIIGVGLAGLLIALSNAVAWGWGSLRTLSLLGGALVLIAVWAWHELRVSDPLIELRLLRHRAVVTANVTGLALGIAMYMAIVELTQFVQLRGYGFGASVVVVGLTLVPLSALSLVGSRSLPRLVSRIGIRPVIPAGSVAIALAVLFFSLTADHLWQVFVTMGVLGLGVGYTFAAMPGLVVSATPLSETGSAMGLYQVSRYVGFSIGSALVVTLLHTFGNHGTPTLQAYRSTALTVVALALATAVVAWVLTGRAPAAEHPLRDAQLDHARRQGKPEEAM